MPFSPLRFGQSCNFRPKVCFRHMDPKGLKSCHFHSAPYLHPFYSVKEELFSSFLLT
ncbi:hypothetical protein Hanom_Chr13g01199641 [Helianthus anomalus]